MFKALDRRCVQPPILLSSRRDLEALRQNRERAFRHGLNMSPFLCADVAWQWHLEMGETYMARLLCLRFHLSAIRSLVLEYLEGDWFFPRYYPGPFKYRLAAKLGMDFAIPDKTVRDMIAQENPFELEPWI
jgi:hypothetical protein